MCRSRRFGLALAAGLATALVLTGAGCAPTAGESAAPCDKAGFARVDGFCKDVDECALGSDTCDENASCTNTPGGFTCACKPGFAGDGRQCRDIDECKLGTARCAADTVCRNTPGGYGCACKAGFALVGSRCLDVDECKTGAARCSPDAACTNRVGGYDCACKPGFTGDGRTCKDVDECALGSHTCDSNAECRNTPGGYDCACKPGFTGDGRTCKDVDECALAHGCSADARCVNTLGGYDCACKPGFSGDGRTCHAVTRAATYPSAGSGKAIEGRARYCLDVPVPALPQHVVSSARVTVGISHGRAADLTVTVTAPGGKRVVLMEGVPDGAALAASQSVTFGDGYAEAMDAYLSRVRPRIICDGLAACTLRPSAASAALKAEARLDRLAGVDAHGTWSVCVDNAGSLKGMLLRAALDLNARCAAGPSGSPACRCPGTTTWSGSACVPRPPGSNRPPVVSAGPDTTVPSGDSMVRLSGSAADPDGDLKSLTWTQLSGPPVILLNPDRPDVSFRAPIVEVASEVRLQITATDAFGATARDEVSVKVTPYAGKLDHRLLVLLLAAPGTTPAVGRSDMHRAIFAGAVRDYWSAMSGGTRAFSGRTVGWLPSPVAASSPTGACRSPGDMVRGLGDLKGLAVDPSLYTGAVVLFSAGCPGVSMSVMALKIGGKSATLPVLAATLRTADLAAPMQGSVPTATGSRRSFDLVPSAVPPFSVFAAHMARGYGFLLGLPAPAARLYCKVGSLDGACRTEPSADPFDIMGSASYGAQLSGVYLDHLGWLAAAEKVVVRASQTVVIAPLEAPGAPRVAVIWPKGSEPQPYYVELRQPVGYDVGLAQREVAANAAGLLVRRRTARYVGGKLDSYGGPVLIDASPSRTGTMDNVALAPGSTFSDPKAGVTISDVRIVVGKSATFRVTIK